MLVEMERNRDAFEAHVETNYYSHIHQSALKLYMSSKLSFFLSLSAESSSLATLA